MSQDYNSADLTSILKTLSAFSSQTANNNAHQSLINLDEEDNDYEPPDAVTPSLPKHSHPPSSSSSAHHSRLNSTAAPAPAPAPIPISSSRPQRQQQAQPKDSPAATITTWPAALKQVMRTVAANEHIQQRIRFLIQRQHDHERQWWKGREALLQKQKSRAEKKRELDEVLRSVGAPVDEKNISTAEEDAAEIKYYDGKVYKASKDMANAMTLELKTLHVPFFCIKQSLVVGVIADLKGDLGQGHASITGDSQGRISVDELSALQQRMMELLQDLCKE
ncbi:hypothetical protein BJX68DRAFT_231379 [Aspergillus pseudodeflectus]|uniref:Uncharacterized protein n=1 Tax=Aspergillus pseudodeflectus TaxID=176178 RepID=A0ABR4KV07_9EURO